MPKSRVPLATLVGLLLCLAILIQEPVQGAGFEACSGSEPAHVLVFDLLAKAPHKSVLAIDGESTITANDTTKSVGAALNEALKAENATALKEARIAVQEAVKQSRVSRSNRWLGGKGDVMWVFTLYDSTKPKEPGLAKITEKERKRRIDDDLEKLLKIAAKIARAPKPVAVPPDRGRCQAYALRKSRATLSVTVGLKDPNDPADALTKSLKKQLAAVADVSTDEKRKAVLELLEIRDKLALKPSGDAASTGTKKGQLAAEIITGAAEHWYLSLDIPVTDADQLKLDEDAGLVSEEDEPSKTYVGFNYQFGDALNSGRRSLWKNLSLKLMVKASSDPAESYGLALGYRGIPFKKFGLDLTTVSPWVGYTLTKEDDVMPDGSVKENGGRNSEFRFGISVNLDKLLEMLNGDGSEESS